MKDGIVIIGAGGHGRVCAEIAELCGYHRILFLDDAADKAERVYGTTDRLPELIDEYDVFVAIGNNNVRKRITESCCMQGCTLATLIHPKSIVSKGAEISSGTVVMAGAVINTGAEIGRGVIINTGSSVDHDCHIGDYSHIAVGAHFAGAVSVGEGSFVGAGAVIINNMAVCSDSTIGAGAVVVKNIIEPGVYIGVPARAKI